MGLKRCDGETDWEVVAMMMGEKCNGEKEGGWLGIRDKREAS